MLDNIAKLKKGTTCLITAENVYGEKGRGGMADQTGTPLPEVERIGQVWGCPLAAARELGKGWKIRPSIKVPKGETVTIADFDGPAAVTHIWMTFDRRFMRDLILRIYLGRRGAAERRVARRRLFLLRVRQSPPDYVGTDKRKSNAWHELLFPHAFQKTR